MPGDVLGQGSAGLTFGVPRHPGPSSVSVARRMARQSRRDTSPELAVRRMLHAAGLRYRVTYPVPGHRRRTIDIAFTARKIAVFIDGCFWHSCPDHATSPSANRAWWATKLEANRLRDVDTNQHLADLGWTVLRFWEHEDPTAVSSAIADAVESAPRASPRRRQGA